MKCGDCEYSIPVDDDHVRCNDGLHDDIRRKDAESWEYCASRSWDWCKKNEEEGAMQWQS